MIPEVKVNHWKWCEVQGNSPHVKWEWCEVNEEVDVYTALWLALEKGLDIDDYIITLSETQWAKDFLQPFISETYYNNTITEEGFDIIKAYLIGLEENHKYENIDEKLYTNEND